MSDEEIGGTGPGGRPPTVAEPTEPSMTGSAPDGPQASTEPQAGEEVVPTQIEAYAPEVLSGSLKEYLQAWWVRIRSGESGALPILAGLVVIVIIFQSQQSEFLTAGNIVNLLVQAAVYVLLGLGEIFALLLSEIDLSVGYVAGVGAAITAALVAAPFSWAWWLGILLGLLATAAIGLLQGTLITRLRLPSFVVTLAGLLGWQGVLILIFDADSGSVGGVLRITNNQIYDIVNGNLSPAAGWILLVVAVAIYAAVALWQAARRRSRGLTAPPLSITILKIVLIGALGAALVIICNINRGVLVPLQGVPYVVPFVLAIVLLATGLLEKTKLGRYIYAIGASPEAARRAGINVARVRTIAFMLCSLTAGMAGLVYESRLGSISVGIDGGTLVLYAVAAAVIGGASLFGGRGKAVHALLGGIVIGAVYNGLGLMGIGAAGTDIATALVLLAAVTVDSVLRRRGQRV